MAFQAVPNAALVTVEGRMDGQLTINDLTFEHSGGVIDTAALTTLLTGVQNFVGTNLAPLLSRDWQSVRVIGIDLGNNFGARVEVGEEDVGGVDVEAAPNNVAACVSFHTGLRGRSFRGRNFVPGIPNSLVTLNTLDSTFISDLLTAYNSMVGAGSFVAGWQWGVVSRRTGGLLRDAGIISPIVSAVMTTPFVRSMRSREIGHGA